MLREPELLGVLKTRRSPNRAAAARALGAIGPNAAAAIPHLEPLQRDRDDLLRAAATDALLQIRGAR
jgi:HEAT repeat protein